MLPTLNCKSFDAAINVKSPVADEAEQSYIKTFRRVNR